MHHYYLCQPSIFSFTGTYVIAMGKMCSILKEKRMMTTVPQLMIDIVDMNNSEYDNCWKMYLKARRPSLMTI